MINKKVAGIIIIGAILCTSIGVGYNKISANANKDNIVLLNYSSAKNQPKTDSFKINSLSSNEALDWVSDNEILTLNKKGERQDINSPKLKYYNYYLSIYNINTGKTRDFKNVTSDWGDIKISPDKKYVIYVEPKYIPKVGSDEWKKDLNSGKFFSRSVKILNLATGEITDFKSEYKDQQANYSWIDKDKLFIYYPNEKNKWIIENIDGTIYKTGYFKTSGSPYSAWPAYNLNIKVLFNDVSGNFVMRQSGPYVNNATNKSTYYYVNVKTNEMKEIYISKGFSLGYFVNRSGIYILDYIGNETKLIYFDSNGAKNGEYSYKTNTILCDVTRDGDRAALMQNGALNILDLKTGKLTKVYDGLFRNNIITPKWNNDGTALIFNVQDKVDILKIQ